MRITRRRFATGTLTARANRSEVDWRAIKLVGVDLDRREFVGDVTFQLGERVWIEAIKSGQIIGLVERVLPSRDRTATFVDALADEFREVTPSRIAAVADESLPTVSVVVPTIARRPEELVRAVSSILAEDYPHFEIIVVDNRVGEGHAPLPDFSRDGRVSVVRESKRGISQARNRGVAAASGSVVAFTDDDVVVDRNWLRAIGVNFALHEEVEGVGGLVLPFELDTQPQLWFEEFYGGFSRTYECELMSIERSSSTDAMFPYAPGRFGAGCNMAFRRSTLQRMGGFNISLGTGTPAKGGEDLAMFMNLLLENGTISFEPAALVRHSHRRTVEEFNRQVLGYGTGLTAMYVALVIRNPGRVIELVKRIPGAYRMLARPALERSPSLAPSYPRGTKYRQLLGMAYGPFGYVRSLLRSKWRP